MKITRKQLRQIIKETVGTRSKPWAWEKPDDHSETSAEEAGMANHIADNKPELQLKAAMDVLGSSQPILDALYRHGLGNMTEPEEQAILARHLVAASAEVMRNKPWNKKK
jgi:hypothetical protein